VCLRVSVKLIEYGHKLNTHCILPREPAGAVDQNICHFIVPQFATFKRK
jgi:hypothetical protein